MPVSHTLHWVNTILDLGFEVVWKHRQSSGCALCTQMQSFFFFFHSPLVVSSSITKATSCKESKLLSIFLTTWTYPDIWKVGQQQSWLSKAIRCSRGFVHSFDVLEISWTQWIICMWAVAEPCWQKNQVLQWQTSNSEYGRFYVKMNKVVKSTTSSFVSPFCLCILSWFPFFFFFFARL
jgi:hypothetical protein